MKCKHCYKDYKDCPYYVADKDGCCYKKEEQAHGSKTIKSRRNKQND